MRPVGTVSGSGADAAIARMEVAVNNGDYAQALAEYDTLPETAKAAGKPFADKLRARVETERVIDQAIADAMKA